MIFFLQVEKTNVRVAQSNDKKQNKTKQNKTKQNKTKQNKKNEYDLVSEVLEFELGTVVLTGFTTTVDELGEAGIFTTAAPYKTKTKTKTKTKKQKTKNKKQKTFIKRINNLSNAIKS